MMLRSLLFVILLAIVPGVAFSQVKLEGIVKDGQTSEPLVGATIIYAEAKGTITDIYGKFSLNLPAGDYSFTVSYVGYESQTKKFAASGRNQFIEFDLGPLALDEVTIVADVARSRETPVAFSNIPPAKLQEELAGRDSPMILNTTPGVYATQQGGGDGDARITIRGFNQRNLAVMIDGIPVNDMENGWVYWSNWFGLDAVTRSVQVQRGLGASKLALPSVGGTMNILTKGMENTKEISFKNEVDESGKFRTSLGYTSGLLPKGWSVSLAGSYKRGNGWVDNTFSEGWFYYARIDKRVNKHLITLSGMGAPQNHDQRSYKRGIASYSLDYARKLGVDVDTMGTNGKYLYRPLINDKSVRYNQHWGYLKRDKNDPSASEEILSERVNIYHKPQFSLRDFWTVNNKLTISNIAYLSLGYGGGDQPTSSIKETQLISDPNNPGYGQINWQKIYDANAKGSSTPFGPSYPINTLYSPDLYYSTNFITRLHNEHVWTGLLSTFNYLASEKITLSGGIDLRSYNGLHYRTITDLLGGDYAVDRTDKRIDYVQDPLRAMKYEGDTVDYYYEGLVKWGGVFTQAEFKGERISGFLNLTAAYSGYKKVDYFEKAESDWMYKPGFTIKTGANYNMDDYSNFYVNLGYLSRVRSFQNYYQGYTTTFSQNTDNEIVKALELGYHFGNSRFAANLNAYITQWRNKPTGSVYSTYMLQAGDPGYVEGDPDKNNIRVYANITGMDAIHKGLELDFVYKINTKLEFQGLFSLGDWIWNSKIENLQYYNSDTNDPVNKVLTFDARGIHVGDAAQTQYGASLRYEPFKGLYMNGRYTYFGRHYADFTPESTTDENGKVTDSWIVPDFGLVDFNTGYKFRIKNFNKIRFDLNLSVLNVLDVEYITDATNNDTYNTIPSADFDAKSATVFFGMGRRYVASLRMLF